MAAKSSGFNGLGLAVLTLLGIECAYRLAFWVWLTQIPGTDVHAAWTHTYFWGAAVVLIGLLWCYLLGRLFIDARKAKKSTSKKDAAQTP
jgi:hypothetical protein